MTDEELKGIAGRVEALDGRLGSLETRVQAESGGMVPTFRNLGIVVGCLGGIIGGVYTGFNMYREVFTAAHIELVTGGRLDVRVVPDPDRLAFGYGVVLTNKGTAPGSMRTSTTELELPTLETAPSSRRMTLTNVHFLEKEVSLDVPFSVRVNEPREVRVMGEMPQTSSDGLEALLATRGLYSLVLRVEAPEGEYGVRYCFWLGDGTAEQLRQQRFVTFNAPDSRCPSSFP